MQNMLYSSITLATFALTSPAWSQTGGAIPVTLDNFVRAETDMYLSNAVKDGGSGKFHHNRTLAAIDNQTVIRLNRDTLYSMGVFDLDAGPVTITMPNSGKRFMSLQAINQDHYSATFYGASTRAFTRDNIGTRYVLLGVRTLVNPNDLTDLQQVHALQDAMKAFQSGGPGLFELPNWDPVSQKKIRDALLVLGGSTGGFKKAFGSKDQVDPIYHLIGTAMGWGGNPEKDAVYVNVTPAKNDGTTIYRLSVKDVPVDAFWSITVYDANGYLKPNPLNAYSLNDITAKKNSDGAVAIQLGSCDNKTPNCLPIMSGWNYTVRLYRPRAEILSGAWTFPQARPVGTDALTGSGIQ